MQRSLSGRAYTQVRSLADILKRSIRFFTFFDCLVTGFLQCWTISRCTVLNVPSYLFICFFSLLEMFQTVKILDELVEKGSENMDVRNKVEVVSRMKAAVASKQFGQEDILSSLVADVIITYILYLLNF